MATLVLIALAMVPLVSHWRASRDWRAAVVTMGADGLPMTYGDVVGPTPAKADNAAYLYHAAFIALTTAEAPYVPGEEAGTARPELQLLADWLAGPQTTLPPEVATVLAAPWLRDLVVVAQNAGRRTACLFPVDRTVGPARAQPHLARALDLATVILAAASHAGLRGDAETCNQYLLAAAWLARHVANQPSLDALVCYERISRLLIPAIERATDRGWLEPPHLGLLMLELEAHDTAVFSRRAAAGERLIMLAWLDQTLLVERRSEVPGQEPLALSWFDMADVHRDLTDWAETAVAAERLLSRPVAERRDDWPIHDDALLPRVAGATAIHLARLDAITALADRARARAVLCRTGLALATHARLRGRLPASLLALTPRFLATVPIDPCTGEPLLYELIDHGRRLHSPGPDGILNVTLGGDDLHWDIRVAEPRPGE